MPLHISPFTIRSKMALFSFLLVFTAVLVGGFLFIHKFTVMFEEEMGLRAIAIARTLAQMDEIKDNVGSSSGWEVIQPIAEKTRLATGVAYIVVLDMNKIRYSHPVSERIGQKFTDSDVGAALANHEYTSRAEGVLGPSVRAFVPIKVEDGTRQVGVVVVGILTPTPAHIFFSVHVQVYSFLAVGLIIGIIGSFFMAWNIKRAMFSMEPGEIARMLQERVAIFQAMGEGVVAIDTNYRITVINDEARRLLDVTEEVVGKSVFEVIPHTNLPAVIKSGQPQLNQAKAIKNTAIISNRVPIKVNGEIVGAVATFRDKTEVNALAEELTGVKSYVEALRVQNHEYMNKLHTIAGLIQLKHYDQALDYIFDITEEQQKITSLVSKRIKDYRFAGMLLGKFARSKELRIKFIIDNTSLLKELPNSISANALVVIAGNLIENAFESVCAANCSDKQVDFLIYEDTDKIVLVIQDNGTGIQKGTEEKIFEHGYSTKGENRGLGLYLVQQTINSLKGKIKVYHLMDGGVKIIVEIPLIRECGGDDDVGHQGADC